MFDIALSTLLPVFFIILLGWGLRVRHILPEGFFEGLDILVFYIGLPAFLFLRISTSVMRGGPALRVLWIMLGATFIVMGAAYLAARFMKLEKAGKGAFVQASLRGNLAYIGLPVIFFSLNGNGGAGDAESLAVLVLAPAIPVYNILCVIILSYGSGEGNALSASMKKIASNPLVIACVLGILVSLAGVRLPGILERALNPLASIALPLALLSIGASFSGRLVFKRFAPVAGASFLKVFMAPAAGYLLMLFFPLPAVEAGIALIFLACPAAAASYVMAGQLGADKDIAGGAVILSTLLSFLPLGVIIAFMP